MNWLKHNFWFVIENWKGQILRHRNHRKTVKQIRRHRKELNMRIKEADELHKTTKKTYYVLPDYNGVLQVLDKANIKNLKRAKIMNREVTVVDLLTEAEYSTATNYFVVLFNSGHWEFFKGTILECIEKYKGFDLQDLQILGGWERVATIKNGKVIKH